MKSAAERAPSIDEQIETLRKLRASIGRDHPHWSVSEWLYHAVNLDAAIKTLLAEKERRLSPQEALDRLSKREP